MKKYVYLFSEGNKEMKALLGGKGANLAEMLSLGLPVPKGFTITTEACNKYYENQESLPESIQQEILETIKKLESITGKTFGDPENPLLLSVRSGAQASMPGMMDTILNLGMNDEVVSAFVKQTKNPRFVYDSYRRFIEMFSDVVKGIDKSYFESQIDLLKKEKNITSDLDLTEEDMYKLTNIFKEIYKKATMEEFPKDPREQLLQAVEAVFKSWNNERAIYYRKLNDIPNNWGTAVNIQEMVYGNRGENSGTGVAFTRNPATGENKLYGEYLMNAQGEDVVAGIRTPNPISKLESEMPLVYKEFENISKILENHYHDMQDMEFTIENGKLYMLQTRNGKRTGVSAIKIAVDMVHEGKIKEEDAILSVDPNQIDSLLHKTFDPKELSLKEPIVTGLAASPGAACGHLYFSAEEAIEAHKNGEKVVLARLETSPEDIEGMHHAEGILTIRGGMTSHAAVVARGMGKCCVSGCNEARIDIEKKLLIIKNKTFQEKDIISLDGSTGYVYDGAIKEIDPTISGDFKEFMSWVDRIKTLKIRANADNETDAKIALDFGAEGIGLVRTEHMFFERMRIFNFRKMILANDKEERKRFLEQILPYQQQDFENIYRAMKEKPVVIRYLDPPLHEFLPKTEEEIEELKNSLQITSEEMRNRMNALKEFNPMMGHRGCRLLITYEEIAIMQTKAVIKAAINVYKEGIYVVPEIMIPLTGDLKEFEFLQSIIIETAEQLMKDAQCNIKYEIGTMIEVPRSALLSGEIATKAQFFSFGTNDLTQFTYGFSRDDAGKFLNDYHEKLIFDQDPFYRIDEKGVGILMKVAITEARKVRPNISLGVCGEHGGEPKSIEFCQKLGLDYVSCSPYRVPIARVAAAQASIKANQSK